MRFAKKTESWDNQPLKILILEDRESDAVLIEHELRKAKVAFESRHVATEELFRRELRVFVPDAILSDYALPGFSGRDAFRLAAELAPSTPFILITGALPEAVVIEVIKTGIDDYLLKRDLSHLSTALKNAIAKRRAEHDARELDRLREKFVTITAHQLRTPLSVVKWSLEKVLDEESSALPSRARTAINEARDANETLIARIDDLLTVITIKEGRMLIKCEPVAIAPLAEMLFEKWKVRCAEKQLTCVSSIRVSGERFLVDADGTKIRLAFEKLLENAFLYTLPLGRVSASLTEIDDRIRFEVADSGIGIPESEQRDVMKSFFRATNAIAIVPDASGVGLSIAKYFIEQHGGRIGFTSKEREGSTFWCEIPIA